MSTEHEFDKQINDSFGGIGQQRTLLSGTWSQYLTNAIAFLGVDWRVAACWVKTDCETPYLIATLSKRNDDGTHTEWMTGAGFGTISQYHAIETIAGQMWQQVHEPQVLVTNEWNPPENIVCKSLYQELVMYRRVNEYEALGGLYT